MSDRQIERANERASERVNERDYKRRRETERERKRYKELNSKNQANKQKLTSKSKNVNNGNKNIENRFHFNHFASLEFIGLTLR